jgi:hypothetical protein
VFWTGGQTRVGELSGAGASVSRDLVPEKNLANISPALAEALKAMA